ncbi:hypothetical protein GCM10010399_50490 [Dactylosporangium fulvum]|uniref:Pyridoxamine 5'-phosphate oxidase family protein n=1 Tax=Dactylosporangium fulvum TaxID=53359 RepID=A0ABY5WBM7_9ACTN|nr:pyridoxamine 5'-phosphate oxidase family protein [Dactylosporangium fulvum]UWP86083.1 pyridoxamine 5'-phosphate oxidase family protein [Dactylosporangium fulvum]
MVFTAGELAYLASQRLGRLATIGPSGPRNNPVGYAYNAAEQSIDIFGWEMAGSRKYRNIQRDGRVVGVQTRNVPIALEVRR